MGNSVLAQDRSIWFQQFLQRQQRENSNESFEMQRGSSEKKTVVIPKKLQSNSIDRVRTKNKKEREREREQKGNTERWRNARNEESVES